jgi:hypothetical protein
MKNVFSGIITLFISLLLTACGGDNKHNTMMSSASSTSAMGTSSTAMTSSAVMTSSSAISSMPGTTTVKLAITITNLTAGQPLSPTALVLHKSGLALFQIGMPASVELERIAEGGNPTSLLADANNDHATWVSGRAATVILPGAKATVMLETTVDTTDMSLLSLTALSMLGNTNDGFTGLNAVNISQLAVGSSMTIDAVSYDAGTEQNTESAATVPGPAAMGEGFNAMRDDNPSVISMHSGVISQDDDLPTSALSHLQRWDNPVARITITRSAP